MVRALIAIIGGLALLGIATAPSRAADVIYYSDVDEYYGWAAGYSSGRADREAESACTGAGGSDCRFALACAGGWGAIAFADGSTRGVAGVCGFADSYTARVMALALCADVSNDICWTEVTFDGNGRDRSTADNNSFDLYWYAQQLLYSQDLYTAMPDGRNGPKTRAAVAAFQRKLGLQESGEADWALLTRMMDAIGGREGFVRAMRKAFVEPDPEAYRDRVFATSSGPRPSTSFGVEIAARSADEQRMTLATMLTLWDTPCTLPARDVEVLDTEAGAFNITCAEGDYSLILGEGSRIIMAGHATMGAGDTQEGGEVQLGPSPGPATQRSLSPRDKADR